VRHVSKKVGMGIIVQKVCVMGWGWGQDMWATRTIATKVAWSVCLLVITTSRAKTAEPIEMQLELRSWMGPRNNVLGGGGEPRSRLK